MPNRRPSGIAKPSPRRLIRRLASGTIRMSEERMTNEVIIGRDGKPRCAWAGAGETAFGRYHDEVWGTRTSDDTALLEELCRGVFELGLSWSMLFWNRDAVRKAFRGFHVAKVAAMTERDVDRLV